MSNKVSKAQLIESAWKRGQLSYKLQGKHKHQKPIYNAIRNASFEDYFVLLCARRTGKSYISLLIAFEDCIRNKGITIGYVGPTIKQIKLTLEENFKQLTVDCPKHLLPKYNSQSGTYKFSNGSQIIIAGSNNKEEDALRGTSLFKVLVDEAGQIDRLNILLDDVLAPATNTSKGQIIIMSTPADSSAHEFFDVSESAKEVGSFVKFTINDCSHLDDEQLNAAIKRAGGIESDTYKREYLCEWVTSSERRIIAEWTDNYKVTLDDSYYNNEYYQFYDKYIGMDMGFKRDFTCILKACYNFHEACLYIEDEYSNKGIETVTKQLSITIKQMESSWPNKPFRRIADNNEPRVLADLNTEYDLCFIETNKESLKAMVNQVRDWVKDGRIKVSDKCFQLLGCLNYGIWDTPMKEFDRSSVYGHFDALAALIYLVRNILESHNPIPKYFKMNRYTHLMPDVQENQLDQGSQQSLQTLFPALQRQINKRNRF